MGALVGAAAQSARAALEAHHTAVALASVALYTVWIVAFLPTTLPELAMGFVFGLREGYIMDYVGKMLGAFLSFALGRTVLRSCVHSLLLDSPSGEVLRLVEAEAKARPYATSTLLRAAYLPMPIKNYGASISSACRRHATLRLRRACVIHLRHARAMTAHNGRRSRVRGSRC
jgi:hypothetical protein